MIQAFVLLAMFFPELDVTSVVTDRSHSEATRDTFGFLADLLDAERRMEIRPDRRSLAHPENKAVTVMKKWYEPLIKNDSTFLDKYPEDWNVVLGPILAHRK